MFVLCAVVDTLGVAAAAALASCFAHATLAPRHASERRRAVDLYHMVASGAIEKERFPAR
jgi:hypothetical protein